MTFPEKATTKDLSSLPENQNFPSYYSSMAGSNTVTEKSPHFAGQGTDSEATHDVVATNASYVGDIQSAPVLPPDGKDTSHLSTSEKGSGYSPAPRAWKEI